MSFGLCFFIYKTHQDSDITNFELNCVDKFSQAVFYIRNLSFALSNILSIITKLCGFL